MRKNLIFLFLALMPLVVFGQQKIVRVGAKHFNEGYILSEIIAQLLEGSGYQVERNYNLGGTTVCFEALRNNAIDIYPEYTGTLSEEILKSEGKLSFNELQTQLHDQLSMEISPSYGFSNTYGLCMTKALAEAQNIKTISDLQTKPELSLALSYEFLKRKDGWDNLAGAYGLTQKPVGIEHGLAYQALVGHRIDLTDVYSTDGEIKKYGLIVLRDDLEFFPKYEAASLYRVSMDPTIKSILSKLSGQITETEMQEMNASVIYGKRSFAQVASDFLRSKGLSAINKRETSIASEIISKTITHLKITFFALVLAILMALPLGILLYRYASFSKVVLYAVSLLQTIPSIALLALMIPLLGIGAIPAITALFLYALLPILRNTTTGLFAVDPLLKKVATGIGLTPSQRLRYIELPLAMPSILAGIRTAAVITIGTATLAAFIGAGGLGEFIVTGLALNSTALILSGAIPAAGLAIAVELIFELIEGRLIPRHLRK
jgi:osmoprotectant transport system permease protein